MNKSKLVANAPLAFFAFLAIFLAVSNANLRRENAELKPIAAEAAARAAAEAAQAEANAAAAKAAAAAVGKAADAAIAKLESLPLAAVSVSPIDNWRGRGAAITFSPSATNIKPPQDTWTFKLEPEAENASAKFYEWDSELLILGDFEPEQTYTITLNAGWSNGSGTVLAKPARLTFKAPKARPDFTFATEGNCYWPAARQSLKLPYTAVAITNLSVTVRRAYGNNIPLFGIGDWNQEVSARTVAEFKVPVALGAKRHERINGLLDLGAALGKVEPGIYFIDAEPDAAYDYDNDYWRYYGGDNRSRVIAFTDLALRVAREEGDGRKVDVFVNTFSCGEPVDGADITLMTAKHQIAANGKTGADGIAHLEVSVDDGDSLKYVVAQKDGDVSCLDEIGGGWSRNRVFEGSDSGLNGFSAPKAFLFSEREICRPGEKFVSSVFARTAARDGAKAFAGAPATLTLRDADGKAVGTEKLVTDSFGFAAAEWEIPSNAGLGVWRVDCTLGDAKDAGSLAMRVANFVPDRIKAEVAAALHEAVGLDTPFAISGKALYYFGEPVSGGFCKMRALPCCDGTTPKHLKGWQFGTRDPLDAPEWISSAAVADDGSFSFAYSGLATNGVAKAFAPVKLFITANVQEPGGPSVSASDAVVVHPTPRYIAMRKRDGEGVAYDVAMMPAIAGTKVSGAAQEKIEITLEREEWSRHYVKKDNGHLEVEWKSEMVEAKSLARTVEVPEGDLADWTASVAYPDDALENGHYRLTAKCGDDLKTSFDFWHWAGEASERSANPAKVMIETDAEKYAPGERATLSFSSPFGGLAYVTAGVAGIDASFSAAVTQGMNRVSVAIPASVLASRYYAALTIVSADGAEARRLSGMAAIKIDCAASRKLKVALEMPELARPDEDAEFTLSLADAQGNPAAGQVAVMALDEGVAALTEFHVADPFAYFFGRDYGTPFSLYDCYNAIYPDLKIMPDGSFGGDGVDAAKMAIARNIDDSVLKEKATVRLVLPPVAIGTNGTATVKARMPDHTGALRFMAVAANETSAGSSEETLKVRAPVSVLSAAPRFAAAGDHFTMTATIFNHDAEEGDATLEIVLPAGVATADGSNARIAATERLATGKSAVVSRGIAIAGDVSGALEIPFTLHLGGHEAKTVATVNVRPQHPVETHAAYGIATNGVLTLDASAEEWIGRADTTLTLSASPAFALATSLAWLGEYPYGCLEQTVSCAFPFVVAGDLVSLGLIDDAVKATADAKIAIAYARVLQLRRQYGFAMWPWVESVWTEGSIYAAHFIFEAAKTGAIALDSGVRKNIVDMMQTVAENARPENRENSAYATYVLALAGELQFVNSARNILSAGKTDWASFLAAAAMMRGGFASEGADAFAEAVKARVWESGGVNRAGMALFIAAKSGYRDLKTLAPAAIRLVSSLRPDGTGWGTTSDNAWATLGLAAYTARLGTGGAKGTLAIGGEKRPFDIAVKPASFAVPGGAKVSVEADGPVFAALTTVGVPAKPFAEKGAISVSRRYVDSKGKTVSSVEKGDLVTAVIEVSSPFDIENAVLVDMIPGGFEIEDASFKTRSAAGAYSLPATTLRLGGASEKRNDRWIWFGEISGGGSKYAVTYNLRAVTPGRYRIPSTSIEDMYAPDSFGRAYAPQGATIEIK